MFEKFHISEILFIIACGIFIIASLLQKESSSVLTYIICIAGILATLFSWWNMKYRHAVSPILWPMHIFFGYIFGIWFHAKDTVSSGPGAAIAAAIGFILFITIIFQLVFCLLFAKKDFFKTFLMIMGGFMIAQLIDYAFISPEEYGEKGDSYLFKKYPTWRVLDKSSFLRF